MDSLFRPEALAAAREPAPGRLLIARQPSWTSVFLLLTPALIIAFVFAFVASFDERIGTDGALLPQDGLLSLPAPGRGVVAAVHRSQSEAIRAGDILFELSVEAVDANAQWQREDRERRLKLELDQIATLRSLDLARQQQRREALQKRLTSLNADNESVSAQLDLDRARVALADRKAAGLKKLEERGVISSMQVDDHTSGVLTMRTEMQSRIRQQRALKREVEAVRAELAELPAESLRATVEHDRRHGELQAALDDLERRSLIKVRAQRDGVLTNVLVTPGDAVSSGQTLATIAASGGSLQAVVSVSPAASGQLRVGHQAVVRLPAFPYQRYGHLEARVAEVSGAPLTPQQWIQQGIAPAPTVPMYRVLLVFDESSSPIIPREQIRAGMRVEADLLIERRRLLDWILDPLRGIRLRAKRDN